jgi:hypothetical protein
MVYDDRYALTFREGDDLELSARRGAILQAGYALLPAPDGEEVDEPGEDEEDARAPCVQWPQCGLVPQNILSACNAVCVAGALAQLEGAHRSKRCRLLDDHL